MKKPPPKWRKKAAKGKGFDLNDFKEQIQQMRNMGGLENLMSKMPGELGQISKQIPEGTAEKKRWAKWKPSSTQ